MAVADLIEVVLISFVNATISWTVTEARIFRWVRVNIFSHNSFIKELTRCGYCFGHWVATFLTLTLGLSLFPARHRVVDVILTIFVITWLSGVQYFAMNRLVDDPVIGEEGE